MMKDYYHKVMLRCMVAFVFLLGILFAIGTTVLWQLKLPLGYGVGFAVFIVILEFIISPFIIERILSINFGTHDESCLSPEVLQFVCDTCKEQGIPTPKIGIIYDGTPNAFTYGYCPLYAKVVLTTGLIDILSEDEQKSVIAHEIGHIKHYDFIMMMVMSLIPMVLYQIYAWTKRNNKDNALYWIGLGAYGAYLLSQFLVLAFSRIREYYADNFAKNVMQSGEHLKNALVKIAYGLVKNEKETEKRAVGFGIVNALSSEAAVFMNYRELNAAGIDENLMRWDLKNVWSKWFEINSTHPLTAKRILALTGANVENVSVKLKDIGKFLFEASINLLPWIVFGFFALKEIFIYKGNFKVLDFLITLLYNQPIVISAWGVSILIKYYYSHASGYKESAIYDLLANENASPVKGIPAVIEGRVVGKGVPGLFWSEDIVIDDGTSMMFIDYKQPLRMFEFLFGIFAVDDMVDKRVKIYGWYKRAHRPYFCSRMIIADGKKHISFNYIFTQLFGFGLLIAGAVFWFVQNMLV